MRSLLNQRMIERAVRAAHQVGSPPSSIRAREFVQKPPSFGMVKKWQKGATSTPLTHMEIEISKQGTPVPCLHLTTRQAAFHLGLSPRTLEDWRLTGFGPRFIKMGRRVFYRLEDLVQFVQDCIRLNTGDKPTH